MIIDCASCALVPEPGQPGPACADCVVSVLLGPPVIEVSAEQADALGHLADAGLVPPLRLVPSSAPDADSVRPLRRVV